MSLLQTKQVTMIVVDEERTGELARAKRQSWGLSLRDVAKKLDVSFVYLCDLERGRRAWDAPVGKRYLQFLEADRAKR